MLTYDHIAANKRKTAALIASFLLLVIGLGWTFALAYDEPLLLWLAVLFSTVATLVSYYSAARLTLAISGARAVDRQTNPELYRVIENLAIAGGLPTPKLYVIDDTAPNAFATGRDPAHAVVVVTTGIVEKLERAELEGVLAHELSHIGNYDIRLMTIVVVLVGMVTLLADFLLRVSFRSSGRRSGSRGGQAQLVFLLLGLLLALLTPVIAAILQLAISRKREYLADASGALLTRYPGGLAAALEKIAADQEPLEAANKATAHLYIVNPLKEHRGHSAVGWFAGLFNTHPPLTERVRRLREMHVAA